MEILVIGKVCSSRARLFQPDKKVGILGVKDTLERDEFADANIVGAAFNLRVDASGNVASGQLHLGNDLFLSHVPSLAHSSDILPDTAVLTKFLFRGHHPQSKLCNKSIAIHLDFRRLID